jgi:hypothetical protein
MSDNWSVGTPSSEEDCAMLWAQLLDEHPTPWIYDEDPLGWIVLSPNNNVVCYTSNLNLAKMLVRLSRSPDE